MSRSFSIYLNILRIFAALLVFIHHFPFSRCIQDFIVKYDIGFDAVILFFVLSGYVISYAVEHVDKNAFNYVVNRAARILPVSIIAILVSMVSLHFVQDIRPDIFSGNMQLKHPFYNFIMTALFINKLWWRDILPFGNAPYWSLTYEVWCYIIYGLALFIKRRRWLWISLTLFMTGPIQAIFLLMWLTGVAAYRLRNRLVLSQWQVITLLIVPVLIYWGLKLSLPPEWSYVLITQPIEHKLGHPFLFARHFAWGLILAPLVAVHLFAAQKLASELSWLEHPLIAKGARQIASVTFTLYLFHVPLANLWQILLPRPKDFFDPVFKIELYLATFITVIFIARLVEIPKPFYRKWIARVLVYVANAKS